MSYLTTASKILKKSQKIIVVFIAFFLLYSCKKTTEKATVNTNLLGVVASVEHRSINDSLKKQYLDSIFHTVTSTYKEDTLPRYLYAKTAVGYYNLGYYNNSVKAAKKLAKLSGEANDSVYLARSMYLSGISYYQNSQSDSAFYYYAQAEKLYEKLNDFPNLGQAVLYKAYIYYNVGEYELCENEAIRALRLLGIYSDVVHVYNCYNLIANALEGQKNYEESIKYYELALQYIEELRKTGMGDNEINLFRASCYNNLGGVYVKMGQYRTAIELFNEALNVEGLFENNTSLFAKLLNNKAFAKLKMRELSQLPELFEQSLKIRDSIENKSGIVASNLNLGEYYLFEKDTARAINFLKRGYFGAKEIKSHDDILTILKRLSEIDKEHSAGYSHKWFKVNDSLQAVSKDYKDKFARIEYETDKLQWEKDELLKRNNLIIGISAAVILLGVAIFFIYYLSSRNKKLMLIQEQQKANEEIYELMFEQQTKIDKARDEEKGRIAMELHDGILNNIYAVRLNLEFINKKSDDQSIAQRKEYIKQLQNVETEIRGVSHDLNRNVLFHEKSFKDLLEATILGQKNKFNTSFETEIDTTINWDEMTNVQKINLYRIIQEGLQNINKYSRAKNATVLINKNNNDIKVVVADDGIGFEPEKNKGGIGLKNFRKRAAAINGVVNITSALGKGTKIELVFPN